VSTVAGRAVFPRITNSLSAFTQEANEVKVAHYHMSYKPFLSIFNMTNLAASPSFANPYSMVDYASVAVFELRPNGASNYDVRFGFKNGSSIETDVTYYPLFGSNNVDMDLSTFVGKIEVCLVLFVCSRTNRSSCHRWYSPIPSRTTRFGVVCVETTAQLPLARHGLSRKTMQVWLRSTSLSNLRCRTLQRAVSVQASQSLSDLSFSLVSLDTIFLLLLELTHRTPLVMRAAGIISFGKKKPSTSDRYPLRDSQSFKGSIASSYR